VWLPETGYVLLVRVEGSPAVTARQVQRLTAALQALPASGALVVHTWDAGEQGRLWQEVEEFPLTLPAQSPHGVLSKISVRLSELPALCQEMAAAASATGTAWPILAHAGSGIAYVHIPASAGDAPDRLLTHVQGLDACVARLRGRRVIEQAPVAVKRQCEVWGPPGDDFPLMRAIKASFDPHRRLNPGRFIGGL
jgi:glycolate oxidase FAD binding subunit